MGASPPRCAGPPHAARPLGPRPAAPLAPLAGDRGAAGPCPWPSLRGPLCAHSLRKLRERARARWWSLLRSSGLVAWLRASGVVLRRLRRRSVGSPVRGGSRGRSGPLPAPLGSAQTCLAVNKVCAADSNPGKAEESAFPGGRTRRSAPEGLNRFRQPPAQA